MEQYIKKATLVAEIKRRMKYNGTRAELDRSAFMAGREKEDEDILAFLDTLEVKEVEEKIQHHIPMEDIENAAARFDGSVGCFIGGAEWADQHPRKGLWDSEKVIEWLNRNVFLDDDEECELVWCVPFDSTSEMIDDLKKAMGGE